MAREMVAMWRTANGLVGVPGQMSHPRTDALWTPVSERTREKRQFRFGWRKWIPDFDRMPPLVQFLVRSAHWIRAKRHSQATSAKHFHLVGQLALGAKRHLSLVEVGGVQFLVGGGSENVTVIVPIQTGVRAAEDRQPVTRPHSL